MLVVKELEKLGLGKDIRLQVKEIPVEYKAISELLPPLWDQYQPEVGAVKHWTFYVLFYNVNMCLALLVIQEQHCC